MDTGARLHQSGCRRAGPPSVTSKATSPVGRNVMLPAFPPSIVSAAGALALKEAARATRIHMLEPVDEVKVLVSDEYVGAVMSDLSTRRGRVTGTESVGSGRSMIRADVPQVEITRYAVDLRSLSHGTGTFSRTYLRHEPMPAQLAAKLQDEAAEH